MFAFTSKDVDAKVVGTALVVSFSGEQPKVWRADMSGLATATLEIRDAAGKSSVILNKSGQPEEVIATYADRESAAHAHKVITQAMLRGDVQAGGGQGNGLIWRVLKWGIAIVFLLFVIDTMSAAVRNYMAGGNPNPARPTMQGTELGRNPYAKPGEPVPADQLFGGGK